MHKELWMPTIYEHISTWTRNIFIQVTHSDNPLNSVIGNYEKTSLKRLHTQTNKQKRYYNSKHFQVANTSTAIK